MTPSEFKAARKYLGFDEQELADEWGMGANGGRTIRRYENPYDPQHRAVGPVMAYTLRLMVSVRRGEA